MARQPAVQWAADKRSTRPPARRRPASAGQRPAAEEPSPQRAAPPGRQRPSSAGPQRPASAGSRGPTSCPQRPSSAGPHRPTSGPQRPASAGSHRPTSAGPRRPTSAGPRRPTSAGPHRPASAGQQRPASVGPQRPTSASHKRLDDGRGSAPTLQRSVGRPTTEAHGVLDVESLQEDLKQLRRQQSLLQKENAAKRKKLFVAERESIRLDKLVLEMVSNIGSSLPSEAAFHVEVAKNSIQLLVDAKKRAAELRTAVEERQLTIGSIRKELKVARISELQQLVQNARWEVIAQKKSWVARKDAPAVESRRNAQKCNEMQKQLIGLQSDLCHSYSKFELLRETCESVTKNIAKNQRRTERAQKEVTEMWKKTEEQRILADDCRFDRVEEDFARIQDVMEEKSTKIKQLKRASKAERAKMNVRRINLKIFDHEFDITQDSLTWQLLRAMRQSHAVIARLPPENTLTERVVRQIVQAQLPGHRPGFLIDCLHSWFVDKPALTIKWLDLCICVHGPFLSKPETRPTMADADGIKEALKDMQQKCIDGRVPMSLIMETFLQPLPHCLQYLERLDMQPANFETLREVLLTRGSSTLVRYLPTWEVFTVQDDIFLARRFFKYVGSTMSSDHSAPTPDTSGLTAIRQTLLQPMLSAVDRERIQYLFAEPEVVWKFKMLSPAPILTREKLYELSYGRIPLDD